MKRRELQGSVLEPVLFSLYTNNLPLNMLGAKLFLFADDTNLLVNEKMRMLFNINLKMLWRN
jgi:hypothetical protein